MGKEEGPPEKVSKDRWCYDRGFQLCPVGKAKPLKDLSRGETISVEFGQEHLGHW